MSQPAFSTQLSHIARRFYETIATVNLPVYRASTVLFDSLAAAARAGHDSSGGVGTRHASSYGTAGTPTTYALMDALAELEGAGAACRAALMPSGLAAISTALLAFLKPGDHLLMSDSVYGPARMFALGMLKRLGVETTFYVPAADAAAVAALIRPSTRVLYLESPGSYTFEIQDVPALAALARARGIVSMIDNAWASPVFSRPFEWGVDLSILPLTKYWGGHSDVLMGAVVTREEHWPRLWGAVRELGMCVGGDDAFLILRGLRTVEVRMHRHQETALEVAHWLDERPEVGRVLHPALPSHPGHAWWRRDFSGSSGLFSFALDPALFALPGSGEQGAEGPGNAAQGAAEPTSSPIAMDPARVARGLAALCEGRRHFGIGYSWGGYESLIMPAGISSLRGVAPWTGGPLLRLHCGLEDPTDLIADLEEGLDAMLSVA
ncbi:MAG: cystathionine beta-lyase [Burkholderiaceae bacterium]|nr:cystathionine beta-lyase [Burkholderiaceae bacterium]